MTLIAPDAGRGWLGSGGGPYCLDSSESQNVNYSVGAATFPRYPCNRLDAADIRAITPAEPGVFVVPTLMTLVDQSASSRTNATCNVASTDGMPGLDARSNCSWDTVSSASRFVTDAEWVVIEVRLS